ncbi:hypothetical protein [Streptomyces sp. PSKA30]|nr:hypothetical protein [Streptomyces sp. PSKA30]
MLAAAMWSNWSTRALQYWVSAACKGAWVLATAFMTAWACQDEGE